MLGDNTALTRLPTAGAVDIPTADILILEAGLVSHREVTHLTAFEDTHADVALGTLGVDAHLTRLGDAGIAIVTQHHADVEPM